MRRRRPRRASRETAVRRVLSKPATWIAATAVTAVTGVVVTLLSSVPSQVVDDRKLGDAIRGGADIAVTVTEVNDDGFYSMAFAGRWDPAPDDPIRSQVDSDAALRLVRQERAAGAVPVPYLRVRLILEGRRNQQIQITDLGVTGSRIGPPARGTLVGLSEEGGTDNEEIIFDLGDAIPIAVDAKAGADAADRGYFRRRSVSLTDREQVVMLARFTARRNTSAQFDLRLDYTIGGQARQQLVDNDGRHFRVSAPSCASRHLDYDHAYLMTETTNGLGLLAAPDPHHVTSPKLSCT